MAEDPNQLGVVLFNGTRYPVEPYIGGQNLAMWDQKVVDGDYTRDSDKIMSAKIWTSLSGGVGVLNHKEGADEGRYWFGLINGDRPNQIALPDYVLTSTSIKFPLGQVGDTFYGADSSNNIYSWDEATLAWTDTTYNLTVTPHFRALAWNSKLYIPGESGGYDIFTPASGVSHQARKVIDFITWDNRIFSLTSDGKLGHASANPATNADWTDVATLDTSITPRRLEIYFDKADNDVIYAATDAGLFVYDPTADVFRRSRLRIPPHPDNALGLQQWRSGEDLWMSAGLQIYRYTGSATVPMGIDRSEGVPYEFRGRVIDLCGETNSLMALIEGVEQNTTTDPAIAFDEGMTAEDEFEVSQTRARAMMAAWTGVGWHPRWIPDGYGGTLTWLAVAATSTCYRAFWGWGDNGYSMRLSRSSSNSRQLVESTEEEYQSFGYWDSGWIDHNMREFDKLASHLEVNMESVPENTYVSVQIMKDYADFQTAEVIGDAITTTGKKIIPFGVEDLEDGTQFSRGLLYRRVRIICYFHGDPDDNSKSPIMDSVSLKYIRLPLVSKAFTLAIPLETIGDAGFEGRSVDEIKDEIDALCASTEFIRFQHGYEDSTAKSYRVRISRLSGPDKTGQRTAGNRNLSVTVLPLAGYDGNVSG